jgi:tripartite ATP-independent transporter DctP family solute receptor
MKKFVPVLLIAALLAIGMSSYGVEAKNKVIVLKMGHCHPTDSEFHSGALKFAELVSQKTKGTVKVDVYHSSQLGDEGELSEGIKLGTVDVALVATGNVTKYQPKFSLFDMPYLFRNYQHVDKVLSGSVGKMLAKETEKCGIEVLSYWESGFRHYLNNKKPLRSPADLKGLKIRTPQWPVLIATTKALGANPVPMPFSELYMACQQGVVDGQEGPVFAIKASKFYEVQKYMVLDGHTYTAMLLIMNPNRFKALSAQQRKAISEAAEQAGAYERKLIRHKEADEIKFLETTGKMVIEKNPNKAQWSKAVKPVYKQFSAQFGKALIRKIVNTK